MFSIGSLLKCALVVIVLVAVVESSPDTQKLASCCTTVSKVEITEPILGYLVQEAKEPCVKAVIFQTKSGLYCSQLSAKWVRHKIVAFERAKAKTRTLPTVFARTSRTFSFASSALPPTTGLPSTFSSTRVPAGQGSTEEVHIASTSSF